jgi:hypothetical protein
VSAAASERIDPIALEGRGVFVRGKKERDLADINANLIFAAMMPTSEDDDDDDDDDAAYFCLASSCSINARSSSPSLAGMVTFTVT